MDLNADLPDLDYDDLVEFLGEPEDLARQFMDSLGLDSSPNHQEEKLRPHLVHRIFAIALALLLVFCVSSTPFALAAEVDSGVTQETHVEDLGNGIVVTTTYFTYPSTARYTNKTAGLKSDFTANGKWIATITLTGNFKYNGITAGVNSASYTKSLASGWSYTNHSITKSTVSSSNGGTVHLTANLKDFPLVVPVDMTIHCSPKGVITYP